MKPSMCGAVLRRSLVAILFASAGCGEGMGAGGGPAGPSPEGGAGAPPPPPVEAGTTEAVGASPSTKQIMTRLTKGPNSLTPVLGKELKETPPPWEMIQGQTKEYARLASALGENKPPRGSEESWAKLTAEYAGSAEELDKAAQARDTDAALAAHGRLANSCMTCHREHRRMGPGGGGPGGPRGPRGPGGPPPGGPPPDEPPK